MFGALGMNENVGFLVSTVVIYGSDNRPSFRISNVVVETFLVGTFYVVTDIMLMVELGSIFDLET